MINSLICRFGYNFLSRSARNNGLVQLVGTGVIQCFLVPLEYVDAGYQIFTTQITLYILSIASSSRIFSHIGFSSNQLQHKPDY